MHACVCGETKDDIEIIDGVLQLNMQLISDDNGQLLFVHHAGVVQVRILEGPDKRGPSLFRSVVACSRGAAAKGHVGRTIPSADGPRRRRHCSESVVCRFFCSPSRCCCRVRPALSLACLAKPAKKRPENRKDAILHRKNIFRRSLRFTIPLIPITSIEVIEFFLVEEIFLFMGP